MFDEICIFDVKLVLNTSVEDYSKYKGIRSKLDSLDVGREIERLVSGLIESNPELAGFLSVKVDRKK